MNRFDRSKFAAPVCVLALGLLFLSRAPGSAQAPAPAMPRSDDTENSSAILARLSPKLRRKEVADALRLVADAQLKRVAPHPVKDWTSAVLYLGFMSLPPEIEGSKFQDAMLTTARVLDWQPGPDPEHADDHAIGQLYLELYAKYHDPAMITPIDARMEALTHHIDDPDKLLWYWCDALFMAPPVLARLSQVEQKQNLMNFMDREWWITSSSLYDGQYHFFYRNLKARGLKEPNGASVFSSRGNGWVLAALARTIPSLPQDDPLRGKYIAQFREMAHAAAALQGNDGLWRSGLLDADAYPLPETSGSALFVYAMAWGMNQGILDRHLYEPIVVKAWRGLLAHVYTDGRLGSVQPSGTPAGGYPPSSSYVFADGAFLLAGSEIYRLARP